MDDKEWDDSVMKQATVRHDANMQHIRAVTVGICLVSDTSCRPKHRADAERDPSIRHSLLRVYYRSPWWTSYCRCFITINSFLSSWGNQFLNCWVLMDRVFALAYSKPASERSTHVTKVLLICAVLDVTDVLKWIWEQHSQWRHTHRGRWRPEFAPTALEPSAFFLMR